ncbi:MAG: sigma-70 family RNA polymerase sigma factor [Deltaproteobacteria bacterium]|nr:sigma-70 family RNA polymerase sigma factor [Deltaproteobacteria bacterium]
MEPLIDTAGLVRRARHGEAGAEDTLVGHWLPTVLAWCRRLGGPTIDAEDAAHDVLVIVLTRLERLREPECFASWVFGITRRVLARHRRRAQLHRWFDLRAEPSTMPPAPDRAWDRTEEARRLWLALDDLSAAQREVLVLCELEERTDAQAARLIGVPLGTVKRRLHDARLRLKVEAARRGLGGEA